VPRRPELSLPRLHVAAGILRDGEGRVLVADRSRAAEMQEFWEFPGGKVAAGESAEEALVRELREELGIGVEDQAHFLKLEHSYPTFGVVIDFFLVSAWRGTPAGREGQLLRWIAPQEAPPDLLLPADAPILEALLKL